MQVNEKLEALKTASEYIIRLKEGIYTCADYFQKCEDNKGYNLINPIAEGLDFINEVITVTKDIQKENIEFKNINNIFKEIINALEREDYILIGDLLEYEIIAILKDIKKKMDTSICNNILPEI